MYKAPPEVPYCDNFTFVVTDDCNLRCSYCYEEGKAKHYMDKATVDKAVAFLRDQYTPVSKSLWVDFIGGEPLLNMDVVEYAIGRCDAELIGKWEKVSYGATTNGTLFDVPGMRQRLLKLRCKLILGLSVDGCKEIHDLARSNSFDAVMRGFPFWKKQSPCGLTKSTISSNGLPFLFESAKVLLSLPMDVIMINTVFEDVWKDGDEDIYYEQMLKIADYMVDNELYRQKYFRLFDTGLMTPRHDSWGGWCGCGKSMLAVDYTGSLFPCLRFKTATVPYPIGHVDTGVDGNKMLPFCFAHLKKQSPDCSNCEASGGCGECLAPFWDKFGSLFVRGDWHCKMHLARYKANQYFFGRIAEKEGVSVEDVLRLSRQKTGGNPHGKEDAARTADV